MTYEGGPAPNPSSSSSPTKYSSSDYKYYGQTTDITGIDGAPTAKNSKKFKASSDPLGMDSPDFGTEGKVTRHRHGKKNSAVYPSTFQENSVSSRGTGGFKLNNYFESLRSNVISSIISNVRMPTEPDASAIMQHQGSTLPPPVVSSSSVVAPTPVVASAANPCAAGPFGSSAATAAPADNFDNYLNKLQNICSPTSVVPPVATVDKSGGGLHTLTPLSTRI